MELKWLYDFVSLANSGNFSRSAEERNVTQSAFSRRIQSLESWLGTELVDRKAQPIKLTDAGIRFLQPAKNMIRQAERVKTDFGESTAPERGILTFTSSTNLAISFLPQWIRSAQANFGKFEVKVETDISGIYDHFEALSSNRSDFLLHYGHGVERLAMDANKIDFAVVGRDLLVPVCTKAMASTIDVSLKDTSSVPLPYVSPSRRTSIAYLIAERIALNHPSLQLDSIVESSIVGCTKGFVEQGMGIGWLPKSSIQSELADGSFVQLADDSFEVPLLIELYRLVANNRPVVESFWEYVKSRAV